jgi:hypothetical protein
MLYEPIKAARPEQGVKRCEREVGFEVKEPPAKYKRGKKPKAKK